MISPPKPTEKPDWKDERAENHGWESFLWDNSAMLLHLASKTCLGDDTELG